MKAISEVGVKKTLRFVLYTFFEVFIFHQLINHLLYFSHFRTFVLRLLGASIARDTIVMDVRFFNWHHNGPKGLKIGKECFVGDDTLIDLYEKVTLEDQVTIAQRVTILTHLNVGYFDHPLQKLFPKVTKPVTFKNGCVVAAGVIILPGITVGEQSFVAAGSVVTKDVPAKTLVAGNPAKFVRKLE